MVLSEACYKGKIKERIIGESPCFVMIDGQQLHRTHKRGSDFINVIVQLNVESVYAMYFTLIRCMNIDPYFFRIRLKSLPFGFHCENNNEKCPKSLKTYLRLLVI